ncbi:hypothetical protein [Mycolicibacterium llatzerense]|uniref:hypothetical protein n=1 Tax=Mycolicibacterium llatzerense TaxID=280871 RepID=UPI0021B6551C|nr:hypothetical protein [Mycolicibacterium llatzerense]MCT7373150.1 hypothetical protein [Mycolicibacterium llatzerense]
MSAVGGGDIPKPTSPHAGLILGTLWPLQSESAWGAFAAALTAEAVRLFGEDDEQHGILRQVAMDQYGAFIEAATRLVRISSNTLAARYKTYSDTSGTADAVGRRIWATKVHMAESVANAENTITAAENELNPKIVAAQAAGQAAAAAAFKGELDGRTAAAINLAQGEVVTAAAEGAANITALDAKVVASQPSNESAAPANSMSWGTAPTAPPPTIPADNHVVQAVDYQRSLNGADRAGISEAATTNNDSGHLPHDNRDARVPEPTTHTEPGAASRGPEKTGSPASTPPVATSPPSSGSSASGGGPSSVLASMVKPSTAPTSAGSPASAAGSPPGTATPAGQTAASSGTGTGTGSAGMNRAVSAASAGAGMAESAARMGTGAISATAANALGAATNISAQQVAQGAASAAGPVNPATLPAAGSPTPTSTTTGAVTAPPTAAAAPMTVMPATTAPTVTGGPASTPPATVTAPSGLPGSTSSPSATSGPVPAPMPMAQMHAVGAEATTSDVLIGQAADAARSILETLIAQTRRTGYGTGFVWAVSVIAERTGQFTAWLASSEGPSYVPRGVRIPEAVRLAVTDELSGRELWEAAAARGGADPLDLLVQHAQMLDAAAPGSRVLALAAGLPLDRVADHAALVGAHPVSVDPRTIEAAAAPPGDGQHRCAAVMPWEWQQANAFDDRKRLQVAAQYAAAAAETGHLYDPACRRVIDAFTRGRAISESDWADIRQAHAGACVNYDMAKMTAHAVGGASDPAPLERAFRTARAAEVVLCLREAHTAEGCADLLYASRLAGAPLSPGAAAA